MTDGNRQGAKPRNTLNTRIRNRHKRTQRRAKSSGQNHERETVRCVCTKTLAEMSDTGR